MTYAIMLHPSFTGLYREASLRMAVNELAVLFPQGRDPRQVSIGGVPYLCLEWDGDLPPSGQPAADMANHAAHRALRTLSRLTFTHALFAVEGSTECREPQSAQGIQSTECRESQSTQGIRSTECHESQSTPITSIPYTLRPLEKNTEYFLDDSLSSLLKYTGKTNERFTRLMLHLATTDKTTKNAVVPTLLYATTPSSLVGAHATPPQPLHILDPMAGKGTTLFEALMHGHHAYGIEADPQYPAEADRYLKKFLEAARYKFTAHQERISGQHHAHTQAQTQHQVQVQTQSQVQALTQAQAPAAAFNNAATRESIKASGVKNKPQKFTATRHQITLAPDKQTMKSAPRHFEIIHGDTRHAAHFYKRNFFDVIVADLPYGIQHGAKPTRDGAQTPQTKQKTAGAKNPSGSITRNPAYLLQEALPEWRKVLKPGGTLVLSWNRHLIPRAQMEELLATHGFTQPEFVAGLDFSHRVDQAIDRDVVVATT